VRGDAAVGEPVDPGESRGRPTIEDLSDFGRDRPDGPTRRIDLPNPATEPYRFEENDVEGFGEEVLVPVGHRAPARVAEASDEGVRPAPENQNIPDREQVGEMSDHERSLREAVRPGDPSGERRKVDLDRAAASPSQSLLNRERADLDHRTPRTERAPDRGLAGARSSG
jgi:hypothetical protein